MTVYDVLTFYPGYDTLYEIGANIKWPAAFYKIYLNLDIIIEQSYSWQNAFFNCKNYSTCVK